MPPTIADFSMSAYLFYPAEESGLDVPDRFPHVGAWLERVRLGNPAVRGRTLRSQDLHRARAQDRDL